MNDDTTPFDTPSDALLAVSAAIDGTATPEQRALVDATPELHRLYEEFAAHRRALVAVDVPDDARERGIAVALASFDDVHRVAAAQVATAARTNVVPLHRHRVYRAVMGAAAALLLVVGAIAAFGPSGGSDDDSATVDEAAAQKEPDDASRAGAGGTDGLTLSDDASAATTAVAAAATEAASADAAPGAGPPSATLPPSTIGAIGGPATVDLPPAIADEDALASYLATADVETDADADGRETACASGDIDDLGTVTYQGVPAVVVRDRKSGDVTVYAVADCSALATVPG